MTALVQLIYELPEDHVLRTSGDRSAQEIWGVLKRAVGHPGRQPDPDDAAERFVFTEPLADLGRCLAEDHGLTSRVIVQSAGLPASPMWLEWPEAHSDYRLRTGALVVDDEEGDRLVVIGAMEAAREQRAVGPYIALSMPRLPLASPDSVPVKCHWMLAWNESTSDQVNRIIRYITTEIMTALFLLTTPRTCELVEVDRPEKLQRARGRRGRPPLIEYKHVKLHVGRPRRVHRYGSRGDQGEAEEHRRRLHRVVGHFRTYGEGTRVRPHVTFVPQHWRGDPDLGIVIREVEVVK